MSVSRSFHDSVPDRMSASVLTASAFFVFVYFARRRGRGGGLATGPAAFFFARLAAAALCARTQRLTGEQRTSL